MQNREDPELRRRPRVSNQKSQQLRGRESEDRPVRRTRVQRTQTSLTLTIGCPEVQEVCVGTVLPETDTNIIRRMIELRKDHDEGNILVCTF